MRISVFLVVQTSNWFTYDLPNPEVAAGTDDFLPDISQIDTL